MTNLEKIIENDGERFVRAIAEVICFNPKKHIINIIEPFLCGECEFADKDADGWHCKTDQIAEWLKEEAEEDKPELLITTTAVGFLDIDKKFRESFFKKEGE